VVRRRRTRPGQERVDHPARHQPNRLGLLVTEQPAEQGVRRPRHDHIGLVRRRWAELERADRQCRDRVRRLERYRLARGHGYASPAVLAWGDDPPEPPAPTARSRTPIREPGTLDASMQYAPALMCPSATRSTRLISGSAAKQCPILVMLPVYSCSALNPAWRSFITTSGVNRFACSNAARSPSLSPGSASSLSLTSFARSALIWLVHSSVATSCELAQPISS